MDKIMGNDIQHGSVTGIKSFAKLGLSLSLNEVKKMINDDWQMSC